MPLSSDVRTILIKKRVKTFMLLAAKHGRKCWYCGEAITFSKAHIDHIVPVSRGGTNKESNLALSCATCNRAKWDLTLEDFISWLRRPKQVVNEILDLAKVPEVQWARFGDDIRKGLRKVDKPRSRRSTVENGAFHSL